MKTSILVVGFLLLSLPASILFADNIYLKTGDIITGEVVDYKDSSIFVKHKLKNDVVVKFNIQDISKIEFTVAQEKAKKIEELKQELYDLNVKLEDAKRQYNALQREFNLFKLKKEKPIAEYISQIEKLKFQLQADSETIHTQNQKIIMLTHNLKSVQKSLEEQKIENENLQKQIASLKEALNLVQEENRKNAKLLDERDSTIFNLKLEIDALKDKISAYKEKIAADSEVIIQLNQKFREQLDNLEQEYKDYKDKKEKEISLLKSQLEDVLLKQSQREEEFNYNMKKMKEELKQLKEQVKQLKAENQRLKKELAEARRLNESYLEAIKKATRKTK